MEFTEIIEIIRELEGFSCKKHNQDKITSSFPRIEKYFNEKKECYINFLEKKYTRNLFLGEKYRHTKQSTTPTLRKIKGYDNFAKNVLKNLKYKVLSLILYLSHRKSKYPKNFDTEIIRNKIFKLIEVYLNLTEPDIFAKTYDFVAIIFSLKITDDVYLSKKDNFSIDNDICKFVKDSSFYTHLIEHNMKA
jgi:hypothetical protein